MTLTDKRLSRGIVIFFVFSLFLNNGMLLGFQYVSAFLLFVFYVAYSFDFKIRIDKPITILFIFACYSLASVFWSKLPDFSILMSLRIFFVVALLVILLSLARDYEITFSIAKGLLAGLILNFLFLMLSAFVDIGWSDGRFVGTTSNSNGLGVLIILSVWYLVKYYVRSVNVSKYFYYLLFSFSLIMILSTASRKSFFGYLILIVVSLFYLYKSGILTTNNIFFFFLFVVAALVCFMLFIDLYILDRLYSAANYFFEDDVKGDGYWREMFMGLAYQEFLDNKSIGVGIDAFQYKTYSLFGVYGMYSHNNYLELLSGLGMIGFIIYYYLYKVFFSYSFRVKEFLYYDIFFLVIVLILEFALVTYSLRHFIVVMYSGFVLLNGRHKAL